MESVSDKDIKSQIRARQVSAKAFIATICRILDFLEAVMP
jgi:hypothetical protein